jgi:hypothetical protein
MSFRRRLARLEAAAGIVKPCNCIVEIIDVEPGETPCQSRHVVGVTRAG